MENTKQTEEQAISKQQQKIKKQTQQTENDKK